MNIVATQINELYRMYDILNRDLFKNSLPRPVITVQPTRGNSLGHFTMNKVWIHKDVEGDSESKDKPLESFNEINIDPRWFDRHSPEEIVGTLLHEMVHYYNYILGEKDCNGRLHNKKFKQMAESVGLIVQKDKNCGWGITSLSDELKKYINANVFPSEKAFGYFYSDVKETKEEKKKKKKIFKITCPKCGQVAKGKRNVSIKCGICNVPMIMEDIDEDDEEE